jgi:hypothetical protein
MYIYKNLIMATYPEFKSPLTQVWQYLGRNIPYFKKVLGLIDTPTFVESTSNPASQSSCNQVNNTTCTIDGELCNVYRLQGQVDLSGSDVYVNFLGALTLSQATTLRIISNSSNVLAFNLPTLGGDSATALGSGAIVVDSAGNEAFVDLMLLNPDNSLVINEYDIYLLASATLGLGVTFDCTVNIDVNIAIPKSITVTYDTL